MIRAVTEPRKLNNLRLQFGRLNELTIISCDKCLCLHCQYYDEVRLKENGKPLLDFDVFLLYFDCVRYFNFLSISFNQH